MVGLQNWHFKELLSAAKSKKEYKKRLGRSPNRADALVISFAYPVRKKNPFVRIEGKYIEVPGAGRQMQANTQYDRFRR